MSLWKNTNPLHDIRKGWNQTTFSHIIAMNIIEIFGQTGKEIVEHEIEGEMCKHYSLKDNSESFYI